MKTCENCGNPMISSGAICGRLSCQPSAAAKKQANFYIQAGYKGENTRRETVVDMHENDACFSDDVFHHSMDPDVREVALTEVYQLQRAPVRNKHTNTFNTNMKTRNWLGQLSNAAGRWFRTTVRYSKWDPLRESRLAADCAFRDAMVMESSREVATRDHDYARHLEYCASNLQLYLRDKRNRELACGIA